MTDRIPSELFLADDKKQWFTHDRFGMFIHWGIYSPTARHEWLKNREEIDDAGYQRYFDNFEPDLCDPKEWARRAGEAGMKYAQRCQGGPLDRRQRRSAFRPAGGRDDPAPRSLPVKKPDVVVPVVELILRDS